MLSVGVWSLGSLIHLSSPNLGVKLVGINVVAVGAIAVTASWFAFGLNQSGRGHLLTKPVLAFQGLAIGVIAAVGLTNGYHELFWSSLETTSVTTTFAGFTATYVGLDLSYGVGAYAAVAYGYLNMFVGTALIFVFTFRVKHVYRMLSGLLVIGAVIPWAAHTVSFAGYSPTPYWTLTPFVFVVPQLMSLVAMSKLDFLKLVPLARGTLVEELGNGVIVIDENGGGIVDINPRAREILGKDKGEDKDEDGNLVGKQLRSLLQDFDGEIEGYVELLERYDTREEVRG
ncbi:MAG: histidine kinase N-terminal 7TM domain-containing protein, partial [Halobacteria archaeon]|nr:histidine kinase N-terminal 7TM domain-containing protein [Halobacteria archaeon]